MIRIVLALQALTATAFAVTVQMDSRSAVFLAFASVLSLGCNIIFGRALIMNQREIARLRGIVEGLREAIDPKRPTDEGDGPAPSASSSTASEKKAGA